jgi:alkanesulfonate monooxygenase SsuD/methylene tetrahydromethanopterin reductase-like flavin-dependent oxidoreductase (luciferase family)
MKFGIFDHVDRSATSLGQQYEDRLRLVEAYDRGGFHAYHLAEHHATPLGMAPSPAVFLAAVAQRSRRLRFGPLVYTLIPPPPAPRRRGDLHARPDERRTAGTGGGPGHLAP